MPKFYIPQDRNHTCLEVKNLYEAVKKHKDDFGAFCYGIALNDDEYLGIEGEFSSVKCYFVGHTPYAIIKKDTGAKGFVFPETSKNSWFYK